MTITTSDCVRFAEWDMIFTQEVRQAQQEVHHEQRMSNLRAEIMRAQAEIMAEIDTCDPAKLVRCFFCRKGPLQFLSFGKRQLASSNTSLWHQFMREALGTDQQKM